MIHDHALAELCSTKISYLNYLSFSHEIKGKIVAFFYFKTIGVPLSIKIIKITRLNDGSRVDRDRWLN